MPAPAAARAVALLGPAGSGKTALATALLGAPPRADGPGRLGAGVVDRRGVQVGLLDPPGDPELAGELHAALRGASAVLLVLSPVQGVDPRTVALWEACADRPRLVVLTQLDRPGADADEAVAVCRRVLGDEVQVLQLPLHADDGSVGGVLDLLDLSVDEAGERRAAEPEHVELVQALRAELVEAVLTGSADEALLDRYLDDDEEPAPAALRAELAAAVARGDVQPVAVVAPRSGVGVGALLDLLVDLLPASGPVPAGLAADGEPLGLSPDPAGPLVAEALVPGVLRVWSGTYGLPDRSVPAGGLGLAVPEVAPGDLVVAGPGPHPVALEPWPFPAPAFPVGVTDDPGLRARASRDASARLEPDPRTGQVLLWTHGPAHAELLLDGAPAVPVAVPPGSRPVRRRVTVPAWAVRAVLSDVAARGGEVLEQRPAEGDLEVLEVALPPREAVGWALPLGRATAWTARLEQP